MRPFEFTIAGPPVSYQAKNKRAVKDWQRRVRAEARKAWKGRKMTRDEVRLLVCYYHVGDVLIDVDNMHKPVQDALNTLVYADDRQVTDARPSKRYIGGKFRLTNLTLVLAKALVRGNFTDFVHVRVTAADAAELPK